MKRASPILLLLSYALICWSSADAVAPLAVFIPYVTISGAADGRIFTPEVLASFLGLLGGFIACVAVAKKEKKAQIVSVVLLAMSAACFIATSSPRMFSACTAVPFVVCTVFWLRRPPLPA
jgi:zinc transporter ZupT